MTAFGLVLCGLLGAVERAVAGGTGSAEAQRGGSQTEVDDGGVPPGDRVIGQDINVYLWGRPDPNSGRKSQDDGDWLEVKGGGGDVWSKGHVYDAHYVSGASSVRGGAASKASVVVKIDVPDDCVGWGTCSDAITMPWDYSVSGDGVHVIHCAGTAHDIKGGVHTFTLAPLDLSSAYQVQKGAKAGESVTGGGGGSVGFPGLIKVQAHDEGVVTSAEEVTYTVTSSSGKAKSGVVVIPKVTDTKAAVAGVCAWEFGSGLLDMLSAQSLISRADTSLGRFDVVHALETSWAIVCSSEPSKSRGPQKMGPLPRKRLTSETGPRVVLPSGTQPGDVGTPPDTGDLEEAGEADDGDGPTTPDDSGTAKIVSPLGLAEEKGAKPGLLFIETDRTGGPELRWSLAVTPAGRLCLPSQLVVPMGQPSATAAFSALEEGPFTLHATLLDGDGRATTTVLEVEGSGLSTASIAIPAVTASVDGFALDARSGRFLALAGSITGGLRVERSGFAGLETQSTVVSVEIIDLNGVMHALPEWVTIPAGATSVRIPLELSDTVGDVELVVCRERTESAGSVADEPVARIAIHSVRQQLTCPFSQASVPVGGRAYMPVMLAVPETTLRTMTCDTTAGGLGGAGAIGMAPEHATATFAPGARGTWVEYEALSVGSAGVRARLAGTPDFVLPVTVVPAEVTVTRTAVTLLGCDVASDGCLRLRLPRGATWQSAPLEPVTAVTGMTVADTGLTVEGLGTETLVVRVSPGHPRTGAVVVPITIGGTAGNPLDVEVADGRHAGRSHYRLPVR